MLDKLCVQQPEDGQVDEHADRQEEDDHREDAGAQAAPEHSAHTRQEMVDQQAHNDREDERSDLYHLQSGERATFCVLSSSSVLLDHVHRE